MLRGRLQRAARCALSSRGAGLLALPKPEFTTLYYASLNNLYDPVTNPNGLVNFAVAENQLARPMLEKQLRAVGSGASPTSLAYNPYSGSDRCRKAVGRVLSRHVARCSVNPNKLLLSSGAGSALWLLAAVLADNADGIIVPAPYYYAYDRDFVALVGCHLIVSHGGEGGDPLEPSALTAVVDKAAKEGTRCRVLVVTTPNNPTGEVVNADRLQRIINWAGQHEMHVIVNELYACSVPAGRFQSVLSMYQSNSGDCCLPQHVHFVWGLSKDFAANGLRCGCIYTDSDEIIQAASKFLYFFQVGGTIQEQMATCLEDDTWVDAFLDRSRKQIWNALDITQERLHQAGVPFHCPEGGLFVWADLGKWAHAAGGELALFRHLTTLPQGGVLLCPGASFHARQGWFRICVSAAEASHLEVGLQRLASGLSLI